MAGSRRREQGPTLAYTDAAAELVAEGGIMSRR